MPVRYDVDVDLDMNVNVNATLDIDVDVVTSGFGDRPPSGTFHPRGCAVNDHVKDGVQVHVQVNVV